MVPSDDLREEQDPGGDDQEERRDDLANEIDPTKPQPEPQITSLERCKIN